MKAFLPIALLLFPFAAQADLFDQRAAEAASRQAAANARAQADAQSQRRQNLYVLAQAFGAQHGGAGQFAEQYRAFRYIEALRFVTGDSYACEVWDTLTTFYCYDAEGRYLRYFRSEFVDVNPYSEAYTPKGRAVNSRAARRARRPR